MQDGILLASLPFRISFLLLHTLILRFLGPSCEMLRGYQQSLEDLSFKAASGNKKHQEDAPSV